MAGWMTSVPIWRVSCCDTNMSPWVLSSVDTFYARVDRSRVKAFSIFPLVTCSVSERRRTTARGRQKMCWADIKLSSAEPRVRRLFLTSMPTFLAWAYTILPGLVKNYSLPAQVSGNNYGTLVYTVPV